MAEGYGRENLGSYVHFLKIAQGSLKELETHILLAERIGVAEPAGNILQQTETVGKIVRALIRKLSSSG